VNNSTLSRIALNRPLKTWVVMAVLFAFDCGPLARSGGHTAFASQTPPQVGTSCGGDCTWQPRGSWPLATHPCVTPATPTCAGSTGDYPCGFCFSGCVVETTTYRTITTGQPVVCTNPTRLGTCGEIGPNAVKNTKYLCVPATPPATGCTCGKVAEASFICEQAIPATTPVFKGCTPS
jgi:hypothetical protein